LAAALSVSAGLQAIPTLANGMPPATPADPGPCFFEKSMVSGGAKQMRSLGKLAHAPVYARKNGITKSRLAVASLRLAAAIHVADS